MGLFVTRSSLESLEQQSVAPCLQQKQVCMHAMLAHAHTRAQTGKNADALIQSRSDLWRTQEQIGYNSSLVQGHTSGEDSGS